VIRYLPLLLLVAFAVSDVAANWRVGGMRTVSEQVWALGWPAQLAFAVTLVAVATHLALKWPLGPSRS